MATFGERLKELRDENGLSQEDLAKLFNLSQSTISYYEKNKKEPSKRTLTKFALLFGVSVDYLLGHDLKQIQIDKNTQSIKVKMPVYSMDANGEKIFAESNIIGWRDVPAEHVNDLIFQVPDDSMSGSSRLSSGDIVYVTKQDSVQDGQVAVAQLQDGSLMIRRIKYSDDMAILYPDNPSFKTILAPSKEIRIIGVVAEAVIKVK